MMLLHPAAIRVKNQGFDSYTHGKDDKAIGRAKLFKNLHGE